MLIVAETRSVSKSKGEFAMERLNGISYYQQTRKCGKEGCHCKNGWEHGPYWYATDGGDKIRYIGKDLPDDIQVGLLVRYENRDALRLLQDSNHQQVTALLDANRAISAYLQGDYLDDHRIRLVEAAAGITLRLV
jgi:hypothetical protein